MPPTILRYVAAGAALTGILALNACQSAPPAQRPMATDAPAKAAHWNYLDPTSVKPQDALPAPVTTAETTAFETALVAKVRSSASPNAAAWAKDAGADSPCDLLLVLDPTIAHEGGGKPTLDDYKRAYPRISDLLIKANADSSAGWNIAKKKFQRVRPALTSLTSADTYPSGHAARAAVQARLLTALAPAAERDLLREAWFRALCRITLGVHYPTDVAAGFAFGQDFAGRLLEEGNDQFEHDLKAAQAEWNARAR